jgi:hypothetical protein
MLPLIGGIKIKKQNMKVEWWLSGTRKGMRKKEVQRGNGCVNITKMWLLLGYSRKSNCKTKNMLMIEVTCWEPSRLCTYVYFFYKLKMWFTKYMWFSNLVFLLTSYILHVFPY